MEHSTQTNKGKLVKALYSNTDDAKKLIKEGIVIDYVRYQVRAYIPTKKLIVCYRCANFNQHADNCYRQPKCYICREAHQSLECPSKFIEKRG